MLRITLTGTGVPKGRPSDTEIKLYWFLVTCITCTLKKTQCPPYVIPSVKVFVSLWRTKHTMNLVTFLF